MQTVMICTVPEMSAARNVFPSWPKSPSILVYTFSMISHLLGLCILWQIIHVLWYKLWETSLSSIQGWSSEQTGCSIMFSISSGWLQRKYHCMANKLFTQQEAVSKQNLEKYWSICTFTNMIHFKAWRKIKMKDRVKILQENKQC